MLRVKGSPFVLKSRFDHVRSILFINQCCCFFNVSMNEKNGLLTCSWGGGHPEQHESGLSYVCVPAI